MDGPDARPTDVGNGENDGDSIHPPHPLEDVSRNTTQVSPGPTTPYISRLCVHELPTRIAKETFSYVVVRECIDIIWTRWTNRKMSKRHRILLAINPAFKEISSVGTPSFPAMVFSKEELSSNTTSSTLCSKVTITGISLSMVQSNKDKMRETGDWHSKINLSVPLQ